MLKIGQIVTRPVPVIKSVGSESMENRLMRGRVIYINSKGRYHTAEFEVPGGKIKVSYDGVE